MHPHPRHVPAVGAVAAHEPAPAAFAHARDRGACAARADLRVLLEADCADLLAVRQREQAHAHPGAGTRAVQRDGLQRELALHAVSRLRHRERTHLGLLLALLERPLERRVQRAVAFERLVLDGVVRRLEGLLVKLHLIGAQRRDLEARGGLLLNNPFCCRARACSLAGVRRRSRCWSSAALLPRLQVSDSGARSQPGPNLKPGLIDENFDDGSDEVLEVSMAAARERESRSDHSGFRGGRGGRPIAGGPRGGANIEENLDDGSDEHLEVSAARRGERGAPPPEREALECELWSMRAPNLLWKQRMRLAVAAALAALAASFDLPFDRCASSHGVSENDDLFVFSVSEDAALWQKAPAAPRGWSDWKKVGDNLRVEGAPSVARGVDGRMRLFVRGVDHALYYTSQLERDGDGVGPLGVLGASSRGGRRRW